MGMYTELVLAVEVPEEVDVKHIERLNKSFNDGENDPILNYKHRQDSYYFDGDTHSIFRHDSQGDYYLTTRFNCKNYGSEIEKFVEWLHSILPVEARQGFVGYKRYEEFESPTLIYFMPEKVVWQEVSEARND